MNLRTSMNLRSSGAAVLRSEAVVDGDDGGGEFASEVVAVVVERLGSWRGGTRTRRRGSRR